MGRSLAIHPAAAPLLAAALLLGPRPASAQFLGGLAKLSPKQIVGHIKTGAQAIAQKSPKEVASQVIKSKEPQKLADKLAATTPVEAAKVLKKTSEDPDASKAMKVLKEQGQQHVANVMKETGLQNITGAVIQGTSSAAAKAALPEAASAKVPTAAAGAAAAAKPEDKDSPKVGVVDTLHAVNNALQKATDSLNSTSPSALLNHSSTKALAEAVKNIIPKTPAEALEPKALEKAKDGLEKAKAAIEKSPHMDAISPHVDALKKTGEGLAKVFGFASPQVKKVIEHPQVANALRKTGSTVTEAVKKTSSEDVQQVAKAIGSGKPEKVQQAIRRTVRPGSSQGTIPADTGDQNSSNARWVFMGTLIVGAAAFGGWQLFKRRETARSPTLLMESEMSGMWGSQPCRRAPATEEPLFRQF